MMADTDQTEEAPDLRMLLGLDYGEAQALALIGRKTIAGATHEVTANEETLLLRVEEGGGLAVVCDRRTGRMTIVWLNAVALAAADLMSSNPVSPDGSPFVTTSRVGPATATRRRWWPWREG